VFDEEIVEELNLAPRTIPPIRSGGEKGDKSNFLKNFGNKEKGKGVNSAVGFLLLTGKH